MELDKDGFARNARLERGRPTSSETLEFKLMVIGIILILSVFFISAIIGVTIIFWRIWG